MSILLYAVWSIIFVAFNFYFSFKTMEKWKLTNIKNLLQHICVFFLLYNPPLILNLNTSLLNLNTASFDDDDNDDDDHYSYCYHRHFLVVQLLSLLLLSLLPSSSSFFCVSECFLTGVWLFDIHFASLGKPFICSRPSNGSAVLLLSFFYLFIYLFILSTFTQSFFFFLFVFFYVQLACVGWEVTK